MIQVGVVVVGGGGGVGGEGGRWGGGVLGEEVLRVGAVGG